MESSYPSGGIDAATSTFGASAAASATLPPVTDISLGAGMSIGAAKAADAATIAANVILLRFIFVIL